MFERLSVFVSGATLGAIDAVCGENGQTGDMLNDVASLTNHSLLWRLPFAPDAADAEANPRFGMLETIREFALERLNAGPHALRHTSGARRLQAGSDIQAVEDPWAPQRRRRRGRTTRTC